MSNIFAKQNAYSSFVNKQSNFSMISHNSFISPVIQVPHIKLFIQLFNLKVPCESQLEFGLRCRVQILDFVKETQFINQKYM